jgi:hypothetical protein
VKRRVQGGTMQKISWVFLIAIGLFVAWFALQSYASESGEVLVIHTVDEVGVPTDTRLWVVDEVGHAWIRAGSPTAGWFKRLQAQPYIEVIRDGRSLAVIAVPVPEAKERVNALMAEKYGWADKFIGFFFSRDKATPIRLDSR